MPESRAIPQPTDDTEGHNATPNQDDPAIPETPGSLEGLKGKLLIEPTDADTDGHLRGRGLTEPTDDDEANELGPDAAARGRF